jgi:hypothetical protein
MHRVKRFSVLLLKYADLGAKVLSTLIFAAMSMHVFLSSSCTHEQEGRTVAAALPAEQSRDRARLNY